MIKITVNASRKYDVMMEHGALAKAGGYICEALGLGGAGVSMESDSPAAGKKACIVTDANVDKLYGQKEHALWKSLEAAGFDVYKHVFDGGEANKSISTIADILEYLAANDFTRSDLLIALGGGITGDVTGFAAASFLRGIEFIQVPTSLLATVDSSVGGKTGVNLSAGKNLAGAFWQPSLVLFDPDVLKTLSYDLKLDGVAEAIKAGFIDDPDIVALIDQCISIDDDDFFTKLAAMAVEVKRRVVEEDERENGKRQLLNLGHTVAHAIEKCSDYAISHGHAVAMGMAIISAAAKASGWCDDKCHKAMISVLNKFKFPLECPYSPEELASAALHDKKRRGDKLTLVIPEAIGNCQLRKISVDELEGIFRLGLEGLK